MNPHCDSSNIGDSAIFSPCIRHTNFEEEYQGGELVVFNLRTEKLEFHDLRNRILRFNGVLEQQQDNKNLVCCLYISS